MAIAPRREQSDKEHDIQPQHRALGLTITFQPGGNLGFRSEFFSS
jgi:hypothetical protein